MKGIPYVQDRYSPTLDIFPIQCSEFNRIYQFYENLKENRLTTTKCLSCRHVAYPPRVLCPQCYSEELEWIDLPDRGKVLCVVEKWKGLPICFEAPLITAWIELPDPSPVKRLLTRIINCGAGQLKEGSEVRLTVFDVDAHPIDKGKEKFMKERVFFAFEPVQ
ncbi:MAG: zinc ribbon domain-containing protein [Desulfohalobiaceae bacterium]|nr:zinc ribbon domain-containing protein [Desulfohalobiaceae bacterium]